MKLISLIKSHKQHGIEAVYINSTPKKWKKAGWPKTFVGYCMYDGCHVREGMCGEL